jgi:hypothetical protein
MKSTCIRCGKPFNSVDDIHTCTPPPALALADELYRYGTLNNPNDAADELRRLHAENEAAHAVGIRQEQMLIDDEALLRQALEALERTTPMGFNMESDKKFYAAINALRERLNHTKGS